MHVVSVDQCHQEVGDQVRTASHQTLPLSHLKSSGTMECRLFCLALVIQNPSAYPLISAALLLAEEHH